MPVNPNIISFNYQKFSGIISNTTIELTPIEYFYFRNLPTVQSKPAWVNVILDSTENNEFGQMIKAVFKIAINSSSADNLTAGLETGTVSFTGNQSNLAFSGGTTKITNNLTVNLRILDNVQLNLSKTAFLFEHTIGNPAPASQYLTIDTSGNWSIVGAESWLQFSSANGSGRQVISLSVNVSGLPAGLYTSSFLVDDGTSQKAGTVNLKITGSGDENDYLNVSPAILEFSETYLQPSVSHDDVRIDSSLSVVISSNVNWLTFSEENLAAGISIVTVSTLNTNILQVGAYPAEIYITSAYSVRVIYVLLQVVEVTSSGIESNGFYFAEDRNTLFLTSGINNAEAVIDFRTLGTLELKNYQKRIPFYRNSATVIIGLESEILLRPYALPALITQAYNPVKPLKMDFTVYDKSLTTAAMVEREVYSNVRFLNGRSPEQENILSYLPGTITVPKDAVIAFSFIDTAGIASINITGAVTQSIPVSSGGSTVCGIILNLSDLPLSPGNKITVSCGPVTVVVRIKPTELSTCRLIYLNEWQCPEVINLDGILEETKEDGSTIAVTNRSGKEYSSILEVKKPKKFKLGTGNINSDAEVQHLAGVLETKQSWLQIGNRTIEVVRSFKSLPVFETRNHTRNFTLTFDAAVQ